MSDFRGPDHALNEGAIRRALEARIDQLEAERDRLEAAIDRHRRPGSMRPIFVEDRILYAVLRDIREARDADAAPGGRGGETDGE